MIELPDGGAGMTAQERETMIQSVQQAGQAATDAAVKTRMAATGVQSAQMAGAAGQMLSSAGSGGFKLEPEAAATLIAACNHSLQVLDGMDYDIRKISQAPPLGTTPGAKIVAPFTQQVATHPDSGMASTVENLKKTINQMKQAYQQASTNYQETEQQIAQDMKKYQSGM